MTTVERPTLQAVEDARQRIGPFVLRTPLLRLDVESRGCEIYLKPENLQPTGAFKIRPALNAVLSLSQEQLRRGVCTVSSGNFAYGVAWAARRLRVPMATYMYHGALQGKVDAVRRLGGDVRFVSPEQWWRLISEAELPLASETWIHPALNAAVLAGNGTMALEILEDLPDVDSIVAPFGGGSLATGIASAVRGKGHSVKVIAVESEHATPLSSARAAGHPVSVDVRPCYIQSIGGPSVLAGIWPLAQTLLDDCVVMSVDDITEAIRCVFLNARIVVEPAGAAAIAAALSGAAGGGKIVCIASGGNIDTQDFIGVLQGRTPTPH